MRYFSYCLYLSRPADPSSRTSFFSCGMAEESTCRRMEALMAGTIPREKAPTLAMEPPESASA